MRTLATVILALTVLAAVIVLAVVSVAVPSVFAWSLWMASPVVGVGAGKALSEIWKPM
jgi:hypothetical protein